MNCIKHKGQGVLWIIVILATIALITLWMAKKPTSISTSNTVTEEDLITPTETITPTPSMSLVEIDNAIKDLNDTASDIDESINDTQLDINN